MRHLFKCMRNLTEETKEDFLYFLINVFIYILPCFKTDLRRLCRWLNPFALKCMNIQYCYLIFSTKLIYKIEYKNWNKILKWLLRYAAFIQIIVRGKILWVKNGERMPTFCLLVDFFQIYSDRNVWLLDFSRENGFHSIPK